MMTSAVYQLLHSTDGWLCSGSSRQPQISPQERARRRRETRENAGRSKSGLWGPTHSNDSEDEGVSSNNQIAHSSSWFGGASASSTPAVGKDPEPLNRSQGTDSTKSSASSPEEVEAPVVATETSDNYMGKVWNTAQTALSCKEDTTLQESTPGQFMTYVEDFCSPCAPRNLDSAFQTDEEAIDSEPPTLGICRLEGPTCQGSLTGPGSVSKSQSPAPSLAKAENRGNDADLRSCSKDSDASHETPADRRRQRHKIRQQRTPPRFPTQSKEKEQVQSSASKAGTPHLPEKKDPMPLESLTLHKKDAVELERSISELTMRSSYGQATAKLAENRRMAYYAVGRHHRQSGRGGNRRCYFTGRLILSGAPFYAGSVQQGLRTLVVFCLPSSIGLPKEGGRRGSSHSVVQSLNDSSHVGSSRRSILGGSGGTVRSVLSRKGSRISRLSSVDDMSLSVEEELDPNWGLDRDYLLSKLPEPEQSLLDEMATRYPAQFETLPVQVRSPYCWRLYVKFCFFSGLPIAEGEMHYKVRDDLADQYGEEIILSHEVMEAVNGDSAEILRLPNLKTFRYLRKHYNQQSGKLPETIFLRTAWEMVRPEI